MTLSVSHLEKKDPVLKDFPNGKSGKGCCDDSQELLSADEKVWSLILTLITLTNHTHSHSLMLCHTRTYSLLLTLTHSH